MARKKKADNQNCRRCDGRFEASRSQCPHCGFWNTEEVLDLEQDGTMTLDQVSDEAFKFLHTGPWDIAFCKETPGIVTTSVTLLGGAPGAGKSTMSIQLCDAIAEATRREVFYIGAEEGKGEYKNRAKRLELRNLNLIRLYPMGANANLGDILLRRKPSAIVIDSLPGMTQDPAEAAEICKTFKQYSVELDAPVIIIDHVTKDGDMAGLMELQHHVDIVLLLFPNDGTEVRSLTVKKNRYGSANFDTYLMMTGKGLVEWNPEDDEDED